MPYTVAVVRILWPFVQTFSKRSSPQLVRQKGILWVKFQVLARIASDFCCISRVHFHSGFLVSSDPIVFKLLTRLYIVLYFLEMIGLKTGTENFWDIFPADTQYLKYSCTKITRCGISSESDSRHIVP